MLQEKTDLTENQVKELIERVYCCKYIGELKLTKLSDGYLLSLGLGNPDRPLIFAMDGTPQQFLKALEKRLRQDHLIDTEYSYGMKGIKDEDICVTPNMTKIHDKYNAKIYKSI